MPEIYVTSDTHAFHKNLAAGSSEWPPGQTQRPFNNQFEMTKAIANNINSVVKPNDRLICLGDWSFGGVSNILKFRDMINCRFIDLILGNHDGKHGSSFDPYVSNGRRASSLFDFYGHYMEEKIHDHSFIMFHYPISSWNHMSRGSIMLHGHCHRSPQEKFLNGGKSMDVGLDGNNYMPYHIEEIISIMKDRPSKSEGHH